MFTTQYTQNDGGRAVAMAMLPPPPTKPITLPWQLPDTLYRVAAWLIEKKNQKYVEELYL